MASRPFRIGVISDTHGLLDRAVLEHFKDVDHILHAGDIGHRGVIDELNKLAPVTAVSGNVDGYEDSGFPAEASIELGGRRVALRHVLFEGGRLTEAGRGFLLRLHPDLCVFGHTHQPVALWRDGMFLFNPGSAGRKRFRLPRGVGLLTLLPRQIRHRHIPLGDRSKT